MHRCCSNQPPIAVPSMRRTHAAPGSFAIAAPTHPSASVDTLPTPPPHHNPVTSLPSLPERTTAAACNFTAHALLMRSPPPARRSHVAQHIPSTHRPRIDAVASPRPRRRHRPNDACSVHPSQTTLPRPFPRCPHHRCHPQLHRPRTAHTQGGRASTQSCTRAVRLRDLPCMRQLVAQFDHARAIT